MKLLVIALLVVGVIMVIQGYTRQQMVCPEPEIRYKYITRSFDEEQANLPKPSEVFKTMFTATDPLTYNSG